jgi:hypothetical protein
MMMHHAWTEKTFVVHYDFDGPDTIRRVTRLGSQSSPIPNRWFDGEWFSTSPENRFYLTTEGGGSMYAYTSGRRMPLASTPTGSEKRLQQGREEISRRKVYAI